MFILNRGHSSYGDIHFNPWTIIHIPNLSFLRSFHKWFKTQWLSLFAALIAHMKYKTVNSTLEMKAPYNLLFIRQADPPQSLFIVRLFCWVPVLSASIRESLSKPLLWKHKPLHDWCLISATWSKLLLQYIKSKVISKSACTIHGACICEDKQVWMQQGFVLLKRKTQHILFFSPSFEM